MPDRNRLGEPGETNPNEDGDTTHGTGPGTGDTGEGGPAVGTAPAPPPPAPPAPPAPSGA